MQVSFANGPGMAFWLSIFFLITSVLSKFPALMPRHSSVIHAVHNHKHTPNGVAAKAKALAKFAHLADPDNVKNLVNADSSCGLSIPHTPKVQQLDLANSGVL